jgi:hypothetical protein
MLALYLLGLALLALVAYRLGRRDGQAHGALLGRIGIYDAMAILADDAEGAEAAREMAAAARRALRRK